VSTQAIVFTEVGRVAVKAIPCPEPGPAEAQVRTEYSVLSAGTEGWMLENKFTWMPTPFPCVAGYQRVGTIVAVGTEMQDWQVGDRVAATVSTWAGSPTPFLGAHTAVANSPLSELYGLPDGIDEVDAAAVVVAQVGYNAASRLALDPGQWVVVYGDGLIGQLAAQAVRARRAKVITVGHRKGRLALAAAHSADHVIDARDERLLERVRAWTDSRTVAAVIDTVQSEDAQRAYIDLLEPGCGQIVYSGFTPGTVWADMGLLQMRELTTHFVSGWTRPRMEATLALLADRRMHVKPLVTHYVEPDRAPEMYSASMRKSDGCLGIVFDWRGATP
jgi:3-hydroxyethyl bacteriochlorophyllide a dehydrogenase